MPGMPDTAASRKRQNQGLCVLSPESDRRTTAKAWRMDQRGTRSRFALSIYVCIHPRDCRIRRCQGAGEATETAIGLLPTPADLNTDGLEISDAALQELLTVDEELYRQALPQIKEHLAKFGDSLPSEVAAQLDALEQRLG